MHSHCQQTYSIRRDDQRRPETPCLSHVNLIVAHRMALVVHESAGKSRIILQYDSLSGHEACLVICMSKLAEMATFKILIEEMETQRPAFDMNGVGLC